MLVAQILSLLYNIVDRIYIARIPDIGTTALGAVGLCFPIIVIITAFSNLFGSGGAPLFSIERGKGDHENACQIMHTSFSMLTLCSILLMLTGLIFAKPILTLFGADRENFGYACPYLMIYLLGTFPSMVATGMNPFINAQALAGGIFALVVLLLDGFFAAAEASLGAQVDELLYFSELGAHDFLVWEYGVWLFLSGVFTQFNKRSGCRFRMEEGDVEAFGTFARGFVDYAATFFLNLFEGVGHTAFNGESNVLDSAAATVFLDEFGNGALRSCSLEKLDLRRADLKECCADFLIFNFFDGEAFETENVFVERDGLVKAGHGNADVFDVGNFHFVYRLLVKTVVF